MAALTSQKVRASFEQVLHVDRDGGGNGATLVNVKDGDNGTTFFKISTNKISTPGKLQESDYDLIPADFVGHIIGGAAPDGWSEYTSARGRMIVGLPNGGTDEGTVGDALTDLQDKTHTHTGPSHQHSIPIYGANPLYWKWDEYGSGSNFTVSSYVNRTDVDTSSVASGLTSSGGTGSTGTAALSSFLAYIQLMCIKKD